MTKLKDRST